MRSPVFASTAASCVASLKAKMTIALAVSHRMAWHEAPKQLLAIVARFECMSLAGERLLVHSPS